MNNDYLNEFITLSNVKNFTRAAEVCRTTQSSLSRHLQALERWAGAPLLERNSHPIKLTTAGEHFLKFANAEQERYAALHAEIGEINAPKPLKIAMPYLLATSRLTGWLGSWTTGARNSLSIRTGTIVECARELEGGKVDLSVCYELCGDSMRLDGRRFERVLLNREVIRPYASASLIADGRASFPGNVRHPVSLLTYTPDSFFLRAFQTALDQAPQSLCGTSVLEIQLSDVQADLAKRGMGVAWLADSTIKYQACETLIAIGDGKWDLPVEVVAYRVKGTAYRCKSDVWERIKSTAEPT